MAVCLLQLGRHTEDHIRNIKSNMSDQDRAEAQSHTTGNKKQHQGHAHHNFRIHHGNICHSHIKGAPSAFHSLNGNGRCCSYNSCRCRRKKGNDQCGIKRAHDLFILKQLLIPFQSESAPF